jgi:predicted phosphoribosyltransferase
VSEPSRSTVFADRRQAGRTLTARLAGYAGLPYVLVPGLPARIVAAAPIAAKPACAAIAPLADECVCAGTPGPHTKGAPS